MLSVSSLQYCNSKVHHALFAPSSFFSTPYIIAS